MEQIKYNNNEVLFSNSETDDTGKPLTEEAFRHREQFRFRCRECNTEFCCACNRSPYHLGFTCEQFANYKTAQHCRFCSTELSEKNLAQPMKIIPDCCNSAECLERRTFVCPKTLGCGHACCGSSDAPCFPCLNEPCASVGQKRDDLCNICWCEELGAAPVLRLNCGHFFHRHCVLSTVHSKWTGSRITFGFLDCPLCKIPMEHDILKKDKIFQEIQELQKKIHEKADQRLKAMHLDETPELSDISHPYYKNPRGFALWKFSFFPCSTCANPYYGGDRLCEGANEANFNPKELVCAACCPFSASANCPKHGSEYTEYKCRFCCNTAAWFCFGTTHFCEPCHKKAAEVQKIPKEKLPPCRCQVEKAHPVGEEFLFGCSLCRYELDQKK